MATEQQQQAPHPGDLIQITDAASPAHSHIALVQEVRRWGVGAVIRYPVAGDQVAEIYYRLAREQFIIIGAAPLLPPDLIEARKQSLASAAALAGESGT